MIAAGLITLVAAALVSAATADDDAGLDLWQLAVSTARAAATLRWQYVLVVVVLAGLHYVATAIGTRAAAGVPLPLGELSLAQLAAAAANRLTPAGLGGSAVTTRYLSRRGLSVAAAVGAVGALAVLGSAADLLVLAGLVVFGPWLGLVGGQHEFAVLTRHVRHVLGPLRSGWLAVAVLAAAAVIVLIWIRRRIRPSTGRGWAEVCAPAAGLARDPRRLLTLLSASGSTTLLLAVAFAASTATVPGPQPTARLGAQLIGFMIGTAAASSVPVPAGLGSTEAALAAVLVASQVPAVHAIKIVLLFRLITFWAPAAVGVAAARYLRRRGAF